ncbi:MAG: FKBP-type peptidyl-prolyl cis-trans isomerase [Propionibacteriaceae bacterium]|nr:FKBP-type peptidyl-prolyl cis-trans isomerase [Propionibacteriaceae bacterium]
MHKIALKFSVGLIAAASLLLMAGCSAKTDQASASPSDTPTDTATDTATDTPTPMGTPTPLTSIDAVTVSGDFDSGLPTVNAPYPFNVDATQCKTLVTGTGPAVVPEAPVEINYVGINASTGVTFDSSWLSGAPADNYANGFVPGFNQCLAGAPQGSRLLMLIPSDDGYGPDGNTQAGINPGDTMLFVVDVLIAGVDTPSGPAAATGNQWVTVADSDGVPAATVNAGQVPPTSLQTTVLIKGQGKPVAADDTVIVNFFTMDYATGQYIENSFTDGNGPQAGAVSDMIPGWRTALIGQPIGTRLLVVVPPDQAYPKGNATPSVAPGTTLVCVIDIQFSFIPPSQ